MSGKDDMTVATGRTGAAVPFDQDASPASPDPTPVAAPTETPAELWAQALKSSADDPEAAERLLHQTLRAARHEGRTDLLPSLHGALADRATQNGNFVRAIAHRRQQATSPVAAVRVEAQLCLVMLFSLTGKPDAVQDALAQASAAAYEAGPDSMRDVEKVMASLGLG